MLLRGQHEEPIDAPAFLGELDIDSLYDGPEVLEPQLHHWRGA